ncbi:alpha/beta hydrolase family protein [Pseudomonas viridiflava]|uniref:alpha/beta hydrolase family protein n=1 Tax=Pseudomonas viridiflava TaxID=33069 RepID=UPI000F011284|nr:alpha/beta hydrolase [Pseudomonas viridiflava]MEE4226958.1 alpha/beta hydrolase [Pseudomonas viridiflava]QVI85264.1 alpha/beta hydrolase [Pseudomonas viridiflava]
MAFKQSSFAWILLPFLLAWTTIGWTQTSEVNDQIDGLVREPLVLNVSLPDGQTATLDAFVTRPDRPGRWPVALITHGTDGNQIDRAISPNRFSSAAIAFARHGYASVVVMRQGYGKSSGVTEYQHQVGTCEHPHHAKAGKIAADDLIAALSAIRLESWASPDEAIMMGQSAGGFAVLAAGADNPPGVQAIINFDGGRGAIKSGGVCDKEHLLASIESFGRRSHVPALWLYAVNDEVFPMPLSREMFDTYLSAGGIGEFQEAPAFEKNGHVFIEWAPEQTWWNTVADFLSKQQLASQEIVALPATDLPAPAELSAAAKDALRAYAQNQSYEKAFATNGKGVWGWSKGERTQDDAAARAMEYCQKNVIGDRPACTVYALGNHLVFPDATACTRDHS